MRTRETRKRGFEDEKMIYKSSRKQRMSERSNYVSIIVHIAVCERIFYGEMFVCSCECDFDWLYICFCVCDCVVRFCL